MSAVVFEASGKFNCTTESFTNKSEADCRIDDLVSAGSSEPVLAYTVMSLILSAFNAVWRTTIPALAGDQVGAVMICYRNTCCYANICAA